MILWTFQGDRWTARRTGCLAGGRSIWLRVMFDRATESRERFGAVSIDGAGDAFDEAATFLQSAARDDAGAKVDAMATMVEKAKRRSRIVQPFMLGWLPVRLDEEKPHRIGATAAPAKITRRIENFHVTRAESSDETTQQLGKTGLPTRPGTTARDLRDRWRSSRVHLDVGRRARPGRKLVTFVASPATNYRPCRTRMDFFPKSGSLPVRSDPFDGMAIVVRQHHGHADLERALAAFASWTATCKSCCPSAAFREHHACSRGGTTKVKAFREPTGSTPPASPSTCADVPRTLRGRLARWIAVILGVSLVVSSAARVFASGAAWRAVAFHLANGLLAFILIMLGVDWILRRRLREPLHELAHQIDYMRTGGGWHPLLPATDVELAELASAVRGLGPGLASQVDMWIEGERRAAVAIALERLRAEIVDLDTMTPRALGGQGGGAVGSTRDLESLQRLIDSVENEMLQPIRRNGAANAGGTSVAPPWGGGAADGATQARLRSW